MDAANDKAYSAGPVATAERLLATTFGGPVRLGGSETLGGLAETGRFRVLSGPPGAPASVVMKRAHAFEPYEPDVAAHRSSAWLLFNNWAAIQFLNRVAGEGVLAPRLYAADRASGLLVIEDPGSGPASDPEQVLLGGDPVAAEETLLALATALGRAHALTIGKEDEFDRIRDALGPRPANSGAPATIPGREVRLATAFQETINALQLTPAPGTDDELRVTLAALDAAGPFRAFTNGGAGPAVIRCGGERPAIKLVGFDFAAYGHALVEAAYRRVHAPPAWWTQRVPEEVTRRQEAVYRAELVRGCPEAADDRLFYRAVAEGCAFWALVLCRSCFPHLLADSDIADRQTVALMRQRVVVRFDILARTTAELGQLETLGATFGALAAKLRTLWPPTEDAMPLSPAFR